jgi:hypothetical protein
MPRVPAISVRTRIWVGTKSTCTSCWRRADGIASSYLQTPLPRKLTFADPPKIVEMAERGGALKDLAAKQALDYAIQMRRGSLYLMLTPKQFVRLCVRRERFES